MECWLDNPEFPRLTVVGDLSMSLEEYARVLDAGNIELVPPPVTQPRQDTEFRNISMAQLHRLQASAGVHLCPSEREGFGHYINEARAVSALVLTSDHPPMNELVTPASGVLVRGRTMSHKHTVLAPFGRLSMKLRKRSICSGVERILRLSTEQRLRKGALARRAFVSDRRHLIANVASVKGRLMRIMEDRA